MKKIFLFFIIFFYISNIQSQSFITEKKYQGEPLFDFVYEWWGTKYRYGGTSKKGIDCSAFTSKLFDNVYDVNLPRTASEQ